MTSQKQESPSLPPCADPHVDGCGECIANVEEPQHIERTPGRCAAWYECTDCGHRWATSWGCS